MTIKEEIEKLEDETRQRDEIQSLWSEFHILEQKVDKIVEHIESLEE